MLAGEKIVSVKSFSQPGGISFVKAEIKNPLVKKVGLSRSYFKIQLLLYHTACVQLVPVTYVVIPLLYFYSLSIAHKLKENFLALSCTEQLQKWLPPNRKRSLPMMSFYEIKVTSTHQKKGLVHNIKCPQVDPEISTFERNVLQMKADVAKKLRMFLKHLN